MALPSQANQVDPTLADVLMGGGGGYAPAPAAAQAQGIPGVDPSLYNEAFAPVDIGQRPEEANLGGGRRFALSLSDALNSAASILGRSDVRTHNLQAYLDYVEGTKNAATQYDRLKSAQDSESKKGKARFLLGKQEQAQIKAADDAEKAAAAKEKSALKAIEEKKAQDAAVLQRQQFLQDEARKLQQKREDAETKFGYDKVLAGIRASDSDGDPDAKHDKKALFGPKGLFAEIGEMVNDGEAGLTDGSVSPDKMAAIVEQRIEEEGLSEKGAEAVRLLFKKRLTPIIRGIETTNMDKDLEAGSPQQGNTFWDPLRALGRARSGK